MMMGDKLDLWLKGNRDAIDLVSFIHEAVELWDDLIDRDKGVTPERVNFVFRLLMVDVPRNPFYRHYFEYLSPLVESAIIDWLTANKMEADKRYPETSFGLRCAGQSVTVMCARLIGGFDWAQQVNIELRSMGETYAEYLAELK